ncbi:MAG: SDR family NAD(P)-dependent oxidoreductase [Bacillus sp. (in: firmicutes)]
MNKLENKIVVITGASTGLGKEIAIQSAKAGALVIMVARSMDKMLEVAKEIKWLTGQEAHARKCDVSDVAEVEQAFTEILETFGHVDVLVNNAGFGLFENVEDMNLAESKRMLDVNVFGVMACSKMVYASMADRRTGHIINVASQAGKIATPKSSVYAATKHAVLGFSNALRLEAYEYGVSVTTVNPGPIKTNFFDIADSTGAYVKNVERFMLEPDYVARKVVDAMLSNKREINLPGWMEAGSRFFAVFPRTFEAVGKKFFFKK